MFALWYTVSMFHTLLERFNITRQCREVFGVSLWRCPSFLFVLMGFVVILSTLIAYYIANRYNKEPEISALLAMGTTAVTFIIGHFVVQSFSRVVEVSRLKSQFLNIVSHQLLTPLTALKWSVNTLESEDATCDAKKQKEIQDIIKESSNKMINIVNTLLDITRIETGKVKIIGEPFNIVETTKKIIALRKNDLEARQCSITFSSDPVLPLVKGDPIRTRMVIENLIDNAIKYSKNNASIIIAITQEGGNVIFSIQDFGVGIPAHEHKNIFQKFFRASNEMVNETKGLGLGLYLVKFIIEASGGSIRFESQEGVGSKFWFSLPACDK